MSSNYHVKRYDTGSKFFHWLIAFIVIVMLSYGFFLSDLPDAYKPISYLLHKSFGLTILALMALRLSWILVKGKPSLPDTVPVWQKTTARFVQFSLYVFLFAMPFSGWIMSVASEKTPVFFGLFKISLPINPNQPLAYFMRESHGVIAWILIILISMHIAGALKHYFWNKDNVLQSMLPVKSID